MFPEGFLNPQRILCCSAALSKKRTLQEMGRLLALSSAELTENGVFDKLLEREKLGSTGMGQGIALPHARIQGLKQACGACILLEQAVDYDAIDDTPVDLVFGLLVPESATEEHLKLLSGLAALFRDPDFCERLRQADSARDLFDLLATEEPHA